MENYYRKDCFGRLAFMGKITSNVTHDLNNVFSIINEYTGIIEDKIYAAVNGADFDVEKVIYYKDKILNQIGRGKILNKQLNQFSHSVDSEEMQFELNAALSTLVMLIRRFALLKEMSLQFIPFSREVNMKAPLFEIEQTIFTVIHFLLDFSEKNSSIEVSILEKENNDFKIKIYFSKFQSEKMMEVSSFLKNVVYNGEEGIEIITDERSLSILLKL